MHEIVLDGTPDGPSLVFGPFILRMLIHYVYIAIFAENASASTRNLEDVLEQLKDMWCQPASAAMSRIQSL